MLPYYILIAVPCGVAFLQSLFKRNGLNTKQNTNPNMPLVWFFGIYLMLLALRSPTVGFDSDVYFDLFEEVARTPWNAIFRLRDTEHGYTIYNKLLSCITDDPQILFVVTAVIAVVPVAILYYKESENPLVSMALFLVFPVFMMNFSGLRQAIAISIGAIAYFAVKHKKWLLFIALVLLAWTFHKSALILLVLYPIYHMKIRPVHLVAVIPVLILTYIFHVQVYHFMLPLFGEDYFETYAEVTATGAYTMLLLFILFLVYAYIVPDEKLMDDTTRGMRNILILVLFIQLFTSISTITMRVNYYFLLFIPLLIPKITNRWVSVDKRITQLVNALFVVFFILYYIDHATGATSADSLGIYPYVPFWEQSTIL